MARSKVELHKELNEAYAKLLGIALELDLQFFYKKLIKSRSFMSRQVDQSRLPESG